MTIVVKRFIDESVSCDENNSFSCDRYANCEFDEENVHIFTYKLFNKIPVINFLSPLEKSARINLTSSFVSSPPTTVRDFGGLWPGSGARGWSLEAASSKRGDSAGGQGRRWTPRLGRARPRVRDDHEAGPPVGPRGRRGGGRDFVGLGCTRRGWRYRGG